MENKKNKEWTVTIKFTKKELITVTFGLWKVVQDFDDRTWSFAVKEGLLDKQSSTKLVKKLQEIILNKETIKEINKYGK